MARMRSSFESVFGIATPFLLAIFPSSFRGDLHRKAVDLLADLVDLLHPRRMLASEVAVELVELLLKLAAMTFQRLELVGLASAHGLSKSPCTASPHPRCPWHSGSRSCFRTTRQ